MSDRIIGRLLVVSGVGDYNDCLKCALSGSSDMCIDADCDDDTPCYKCSDDGKAYFIKDENFKADK